MANAGHFDTIGRDAARDSGGIHERHFGLMHGADRRPGDESRPAVGSKIGGRHKARHILKGNSV
ncbi:hypothetical protein H721_00409 [Brucella ovis IntaBari-2006-46-332]|nr:hypothetical protein C010_00381 [Brucella ovis 80/125]ENR10166.1 hypothetical protein C961_00383 [Brucella ovis F8/05B]ENS96569.1 hypothetical protein B999_00719 [Brucella ovis 63/96]ENT01587.1 hypothetical protein C009_00399 [Brucella ovis 81/8]ENT79966.1 hypothetical protein H712_00379 [Brucella ovis IntaBari-2009-88-4]ENT82530.1 hypothetical protein H720_00383 [Brucella ovis IntaBari-2006-46-348]ENT85058.1 hypothetical protein H713_00380 [Brucella ovis IntaBari-2010-47-268]ENT90759.1 h